MLVYDQNICFNFSSKAITCECPTKLSPDPCMDDNPKEIADEIPPISRIFPAFERKRSQGGNPL